MQTADRSFLGGLPLGRVLRIPVRVHVSLIVIFGLIVLQLGAAGLPDSHPFWSPWLVWTVAVVAALAFFASVLLHELGHAIVARRMGLEVSGITLFLFGGVAQVRGEAPSARGELAMAVVGPLISFAIGFVCTAIGGALAYDAIRRAGGIAALASVGPVTTLLLWVGPINLLLAAFNLLPGFPLDGGRILRALLWWKTGDIEKSTRWAALAGRVVASLVIALGVSMMFGVVWPVLGGGLVAGLWLVLIGWFLFGAAQASYQQVAMRRVLEGVPVTALMQTEVVPLAPDVSVAEVARRCVMESDRRAFPVVVDGRLVGLVCLDDLKRAPYERWAETPVAEVMTPLESLVHVGPKSDASDAAEELARRDVDQVPVVEGDRLLGLVRRADILRFLQLRTPALPA
jgi:Zn-dependent protease/CBS domain-containing protein